MKKTVNAALSGALFPEYFGADPTGGGNADENSAAMQAMFDSMGTVCGPTVRFTPGAVYLLGDTVNFPNFASGAETFRVEAYGVRFQRESGKLGGFFARRQDSKAAFNSIEYGRLNWSGGLFEGNADRGSYGIDYQMSYQARFSDMKFVGTEASLVLTFNLQTVVERVESVNALKWGFLIRSGSSQTDDGFGVNGVWNDGGSAASTASNACHFYDCRVYGLAGNKAAYANLGSDQWILENCISEGHSDLYDVFIDWQGNTSFTVAHINKLWCEAPQTKVNIKAAWAHSLVVNDLQLSYPSALLDASGTGGSSTFLLNGLNIHQYPQVAIATAYADDAVGTNFSLNSITGKAYVGALVGPNAVDKTGLVHRDFQWEPMSSSTSTMTHNDGGFVNIAWSSSSDGTADFTIGTPATCLHTYIGVRKGGAAKSANPSTYVWQLISENDAIVLNADTTNPLGRMFFNTAGGGYGGTEGGGNHGETFEIRGLTKAYGSLLSDPIRYEGGGASGWGNGFFCFGFDGTGSTDTPTIRVGSNFVIGATNPGGDLDLNFDTVRQNGDKVLDGRQAGWQTPTGAAQRTDFDPGSVTLSDLAEQVNALKMDLHANAGHGLIG